MEGFFNDLADPEVETFQFDIKAAVYLTKHRGEVAARTTCRRLGTLRSFARFYGISRPLKNYNAPTPPKTIPHPVPGSVQAVKRMILNADSFQDKALIALCGLAGLRVSEACDLTVEDVDFERDLITVHGKGDKFRVVPMSRRVREILVERALERPWFFVPIHERTARKKLKKFGKAEGIDLSSHDLRATFATAAYQKTKDLRAVQELLGHESSDTTQIYTGISMDSMRDAAEL